ncbi:MAG: hypothetical protein KAG53_04710 [Endozoicomonadaceae bacterium]|nr:hypothetical protein [Endozoicomonadaceae bacterium]
MIILRTLLLITLSLLMSMAAKAEIDNPGSPDNYWYQIDVLIIRRLDKVINSQEAWPPVAVHRMPLNAIKLYTVQQHTVDKLFLPESVNSTEQETMRLGIDQAADLPLETSTPVDRIPDITTEPFIQLPSNDQLLNREAASIKRSRDYQLIYQASWRMELPPETHDVHIYIEAGQQVGDDYELEGIITLSAYRFLHAAPQLWFNRLNPIQPIHQLILGRNLLVESQSQASTLTMSTALERSLPRVRHYTGNFLMEDSRQLHSNIINYFDSPTIAVLLAITPYKV